MLKTDLSGLNIYTAEQCRTLDKIAIEDAGIPGFTLMRKAARAAFQWLLKQNAYQQVSVHSKSSGYQQKVIVFAGTGNNGGDGFVLAALAKEYGFDTQVYVMGDVEKIQGDAQLAYAEALENGVSILPYDERLELKSGFIVDAMLGTGLGGGDVRGAYADAIELINQSELPVLSLDVPSGLCSDTGAILGSAVKAAHTMTFIGLKRGLMIGKGPEVSGKVVLSELEIPESVYCQVAVNATIVDTQNVTLSLEPRARESHKGLFGHVLVVGGDYGMAGAVAMAAEAAARVGAGLVSVATRPEHIAPIVSRRPEVMVHGIHSGQQLAPLLESATILVIGPGLGKSTWSEQLWQQAYQSDLPMVVDADALNLISEKRIVEKPYKNNWILTPHPGEASRLLNQSTADIQSDRFKSAKALQNTFGGVAVLKGAGSLIADDAVTSLCQAGNPGMSTGGMGDVLSGVIAGMLAQGLSLAQSARTGVTLHAMAADMVMNESGERGLLATDLMEPLRRLVN